jgi:hypothetical protein
MIIVAAFSLATEILIALTTIVAQTRTIGLLLRLMHLQLGIAT